MPREGKTIRRTAWLPAWLRDYRRAWLPKDALAGVLAAGVLIPEAVAYARLAGLPARAGLSVLVLPVLAYALLGSSRQLAVSPSATVSLLVALALAPAAADPVRYGWMAALLALMVGALFVVAWGLRLGFLSNLLSSPVIYGYAAGVAVTLAATRAVPLLGLGEAPERLLRAVDVLAEQLPRLQVIPAVFGLACLTALLVLRRLTRGLSGALVVAVAGTVAVAWLNLQDSGVGTLGRIPTELPELTVPEVDPRWVPRFFVAALAIFVVTVTESTSLARLFAQRHRYRLEPDRELFALGAAQVAAGLTRGFPIGAGAADTALLERLGARTPLVGLFTAAVVAIFLVASPALPNVPTAVFDAVLIAAAVELVAAKRLRALWHFSRLEFAFAAVAFLGVALVGPLMGVFLGLAVTVISLLLRISRPRVVELGRLPGGAWAARDTRPEARPPQEVLVVRPYAPLLFASAPAVTEAALELVRGRETPPVRVVLDLSASLLLDATGVEQLQGFLEILRGAGIGLQVAGASRTMRETLARAGLAERLGAERRRSVEEVVGEEAGG